MKLRHHIVNGDAKNHLAALHHLMNCPGDGQNGDSLARRGAYQQKPVHGFGSPLRQTHNPLLFCSNFLLWRLQVGYHSAGNSCFSCLKRASTSLSADCSPRCHCWCTDAHNLTCEKGFSVTVLYRGKNVVHKKSSHVQGCSSAERCYQVMLIASVCNLQPPCQLLLPLCLMVCLTLAIQ